MDCTDIFDLSTEELLRELGNWSNCLIDGHTESQAWRQHLIRQELQERQGFEHLAHLLHPSFAPAKSNPPSEANRLLIEVKQPLSLQPLLQRNTFPFQQKAGLVNQVFCEPADDVTQPVSVNTKPKRGDVVEAPTQVQNARQGRRHQTRNPTRARVRKGSEGHKTERVLTEVVIGSAPVLASPRRRSSVNFPKGDTERRQPEIKERGQNGRETKGSAKENAGRNREIELSGGLRTSGQMGGSGRSILVGKPGKTGGVGLRTDEAEEGGSIDGKTSGRDGIDPRINGVGEASVRPASATVEKPSVCCDDMGGVGMGQPGLLRDTPQEVHSSGEEGGYRGQTKGSRIEPAVVAEPGRGILFSGITLPPDSIEPDSDAPGDALSVGAPSDASCVSELSNRLTFEPIESGATLGPGTERSLETELTASTESLESTRTESTRVASDGTNRAPSVEPKCDEAGSADDWDASALVGEWAPAGQCHVSTTDENMRCNVSKCHVSTGDVDWDTHHALEGPAVGLGDRQIDAGSESVEKSCLEAYPPLDLPGTASDSLGLAESPVLERRQSTVGTVGDEPGLEPALSGGLAQLSLRESSSGTVFGDSLEAGSAKPGSSEANEISKPVSAVTVTEVKPSLLTTRAKVGSPTSTGLLEAASPILVSENEGLLSRLEHIFTRYAPGQVSSGGSRPGLALQHFFKDVATCLEADTHLTATALGGSDARPADAQLLLRVDAKDHPEVSDLLTSCARSLNWAVDVDSQSATWNVLWTWAARPRVDYTELLTWQKVNHFTNSKQLTRKDLLKGHLARFSRSANALMPTTFTLPREYVAFVRAFSDRRTNIRDPAEASADVISSPAAPAADVSRVSEKRAASAAAGVLSAENVAASGPDVSTAAAGQDEGAAADVSNTAGRAGAKGAPWIEQPPREGELHSIQCDNLWIMKPVGRSRGEGIFLVSDICHVAYGEAMVVQKYVERPLLLYGHKFDLRLYVLVTLFNPLEAFLYQEGFARFASRPYTRSAAALRDMLVHLTNTEVQKQRDHVPSFLLAQSGADTCCSADCSMLQEAINGRGQDSEINCEGETSLGVGNCQEKAPVQKRVEDRGLSVPEAVVNDTGAPVVRVATDSGYADRNGSGPSTEFRSEQQMRSSVGDTAEQTRGVNDNQAFGTLYGGCKVSLGRAFELMVKHGVNVDRLWRRITALVLQSLEAVQVAIPANKNCFELFGYDVLVDETHRPWLVEVNSSPSMETGTPLDCALKGSLIRDTLALIDPLPFNREELTSVLHRRAAPAPSIKTKADRTTRHDPLYSSDMAKILIGRRERKCGDAPVKSGNYQRIAPAQKRK